MTLKADNPQPALLITAAYAMAAEGGGVQRCTREYIATLAAAGYAPEVLEYGIDRHLLTRLRRKLRRRPYRDLIPTSFLAAARRAIAERRPAWVFFNQIEAAQVVDQLADCRGPRTRFALLSHGVDSSDYLHESRVAAQGRARANATWLGQQLLAEMRMQPHFDVIFCLSETDRLFHQWLGGRVVHVLPRIIEEQPLDWQPVRGRIGTVSTLDHAPNFEGISRFAAALQQSGRQLELRVIGRPQARGEELARRFPIIRYLGGVDDATFAAEAATWSVFVNPVFCYARGASTKLALPLGWHLPVASTRAGARGYRWDETLVPLADTDAELVTLAAGLDGDPQARSRVAALAARSPRLDDVGGLMKAALSRP